MFDDQKPQIGGGPANPTPTPTTPTPPTNTSQPPSQPPATGTSPSTPPVEDMFEGSDQSGPQMQKPGSPGQASNVPVGQPDSDIYGRQSILSKIFMAIFVIVVVGVVAYAGWWSYNYFSNRGGSDLPSLNQNLNAGVNQNVNLNVNANTNVNQNANTNINTNTNQNANVGPTDSDSDGLSDVEERNLGTDPNKPDSDRDGLRDWSEVNVYGTDPLNPDTDGDTYKDGEEVINGYDPTRPGSARLYEVPQ